jgi:hypothetical protein
MGITQYRDVCRGRYGSIRQGGGTTGMARPRESLLLCANFCLQRHTVVPISFFLLPSFASVDSAALIVFKK